MKARVLVAEDDTRARESLRVLLADEGYEVCTAADGVEALARLADGMFDAVLLDVRMPGKDGLTLLDELRDKPDHPAVLVMTAFGNSSVAIEAMKLGAYDYLSKPLHFDELLIQLERAVASRRQALELEAYRAEGSPAEQPAIVGNSAVMQQVYKLIGQVARSDSTVLICGESGTGKELIARAIHAHSRRSEAPLIVVNCAAIPASLLESELFGHERGAFTGAVARRRGRFELADRGTIFLDEIGELAPDLQAKLLRVLEERTIERLGSERVLSLDVRILAATNRDLEQAVRDGAFREDLYYRLKVVTIVVPPLRSRREDVPELSQRLIRLTAARLALPPAPLTDAALEALCKRDWPGNVRELEHVLERALVICRGAPITAEHLGDARDSPADPFEAVAIEEGMHALVSRLEKKLIERALATAAGNRTRAAEILKIHRRLLYEKLKEFNLE